MASPPRPSTAPSPSSRLGTAKEQYFTTQPAAWQDLSKSSTLDSPPQVGNPRLAAMMEHGYILGQGGSVRIKQQSPTLAVTWSSDGLTTTSGARSPWSTQAPRLAQGSAALQRPRSAAAARSRAGPKGEQNASRHPAGREDVQQLCYWLQGELAAAADEPEAELQVWDEACQELARQAGIHCAERGRLIELTRQHFMSTIEGLKARLDNKKGLQDRVTAAAKQRKAVAAIQVASSRSPTLLLPAINPAPASHQPCSCQQSALLTALCAIPIAP